MIDVDFFKTWSKEMAYVLGYFSADGGMFINSEGSRYIQFVSTDYSLLEKVKKAMNSRHKIYLKAKRDEKRKNAYLLEIGSKEMYSDLLKLGFIPRKEKRLNLSRKCLYHI
ncbi:MAG: LAGLIDADG family homing endonuclease [Candidatus Omnitrophica bacterium]|nr:LAGLIDADG family homing endonuclease [Candidatus Omnitrophota bacterium]